jgi:hypothetical protein
MRELTQAERICKSIGYYSGAKSLLDPDSGQYQRYQKEFDRRTLMLEEAMHEEVQAENKRVLEAELNNPANVIKRTEWVPFVDDSNRAEIDKLLKVAKRLDRRAAAHSDPGYIALYKHHAKGYREDAFDLIVKTAAKEIFPEDETYVPKHKDTIVSPVPKFPRLAAALHREWHAKGIVYSAQWGDLSGEERNTVYNEFVALNSLSGRWEASFTGSLNNNRVDITVVVWPGKLDEFKDALFGVSTIVSSPEEVLTNDTIVSRLDEVEKRLDVIEKDTIVYPLLRQYLSWADGEYFVHTDVIPADKFEELRGEYDDLCYQFPNVLRCWRHYTGTRVIRITPSSPDEGLAISRAVWG